MASWPSLPTTFPHPAKHLISGPTGTAGHPNLLPPTHTYVPDFSLAHASFLSKIGHHLVPALNSSWGLHRSWCPTEAHEWVISLVYTQMLAPPIAGAEAQVPEISQDSCDSAECRT